MVADRSETVVPKGYKLAWDDGRLNSQRGKGTARGWADQDQVWTRDIPAVAVSEAAQPVKKRVATSSSASEPAATRKSVSTKSTGGKAYIQVGTFGVASNADGAASRLQDLGLPVARAKFSKGGKALQIVMAGPFASASDAQSVLGAVRGAGFGDAFVK
jgi:cell division protein FtsN